MKINALRAGKIYFWEFFQNFPLLLGFTCSLASARQNDWWLIGLSASVGSILGALAIWYTDPFIVPGTREPFAVTRTNMIVFFLVAMGMALYFAQNWGTWPVDVLLGAILGMGVGYGQDLAAGTRKPGFRHILALMLAFVPAILTIRLITVRYPPLPASLILNAFMTLIIVTIDYLSPKQQPGVTA
ncbi:MAG TPA: hypothetical protein PK530_10085 [Anaerolineales bacterium]|nr:hypothetical protein [Anaerolineales bacterium]